MGVSRVVGKTPPLQKIIFWKKKMFWNNARIVKSIVQINLIWLDYKCTWSANLCTLQPRNLSDEAELLLRGHRHRQTLRVHEVRGQTLRFQPYLVLAPWKPKHLRLNGGAVPVINGVRFIIWSKHLLLIMPHSHLVKISVIQILNQYINSP